MRSTRTLPLALMGVALLATACSSGEAEDMGQAEAPETAATEAAPTQTAAAQELSCFLRAESMEAAQDRPSPLRTVSVTLDGEEALLCYGAPAMRGREIMGALVPFDTPWRMGANEATALHLPFAAEIGDVSVEPGSYSLWATPGESEWVIHVNGNAERWGIPINDEVQAADVGSFTVTPEATNDVTETLTYTWESHGEGMGHIVLRWANTQVEIPVHAAGM